MNSRRKRLRYWRLVRNITERKRKAPVEKQEALDDQRNNAHRKYIALMNGMHPADCKDMYT